MRTVSYTLDAAKDLKRHGNMAARVRKAVNEYAAETGAHANNVIPAANASRFGEIAPRGSVYD